MPHVRLAGTADAAGWRDAARALLLARIPPDAVDWRCDEPMDLFGDGATSLPPPAPQAPPPRVPRCFLDLAEAAVCHADPARFTLLYRLLWRLQEMPGLLGFAPDPDVQRLSRMAKAVHRDCHKMTAFVRFRELPPGTHPRRRFAAWFEPDHHIVARTAPFFAARFGDMDWLILTPKGSAGCCGGALTFSEAPASPPALEDATETLWATYFTSIFNPARLKVKAMQAEMPKKYWKNLPEAALIPGLIAGAEARVAAMAEQPHRAPPAFHDRIARHRPQRPSLVDESGGPPATLEALRVAAAACTRCPLHRHATRTVFGEGPADAALMILGEQPGDQEDLTGRPFIGPAGQLLDATLGGAGIDRQAVWVTNAVKHFKFTPRGKRRIHQRPDRTEISHCRWWLEREVALVRPKLILVMGATALEALTGERAGMTALRGRVIETGAGSPALVTWHPAYLLRLPDPSRAAEATAQFRHDVGEAAAFLAAHP